MKPLLKSTGIKVRELSNQEMLNHPASEYNRRIWEEKVNSMIILGAKFYVADPTESFKYERFFTTYKIKEGLFFISTFGYSSGLTNRGFVMAYIFDGEIFTKGFGDEGKECIVNTKEGRKWLADNICKNNIMVTNCL